jgi:hypothetical protein
VGDLALATFFLLFPLALHRLVVHRLKTALAARWLDIDALRLGEKFIDGAAGETAEGAPAHAMADEDPEKVQPAAL